MVTHSSTSRPVQCLCMAERTGCPVFTDLWSYVLEYPFCANIMSHQKIILESLIMSVSELRQAAFLLGDRERERPDIQDQVFVI